MIERKTIRQVLAACCRKPAAFGLLGFLGLLAGCGGFGAGDGRYIPTTPGGGGTPLGPTFSSLQVNVFTPRCALSGCHTGAGVFGLSLDADVSYANLVGKASAERPELLRVDPNNPGVSYIVKKVQGDPDVIGARMPLNGPPFLSTEQINALRQWIQDGARDDRSSSLSAPGAASAETLFARDAAAASLERLARLREPDPAFGFVAPDDRSSPPFEPGRDGSQLAWPILTVARLARVRDWSDPADMFTLLSRAAGVCQGVVESWKASGEGEPVPEGPLLLQAMAELAGALDGPVSHRIPSPVAEGLRRRAAWLASRLPEPNSTFESSRSVVALSHLLLADPTNVWMRARAEALADSLAAGRVEGIGERADVVESLAWATLVLRGERFSRELRFHALALRDEMTRGGEPLAGRDLAAVLGAASARRLTLEVGDAPDSWDLLLDAVRQAKSAGIGNASRLASEQVPGCRPESLGLEPTAQGWRRDPIQKEGE